MHPRNFRPESLREMSISWDILMNVFQFMSRWMGKEISVDNIVFRKSSILPRTLQLKRGPFIHYRSFSIHLLGILLRWVSFFFLHCIARFSLKNLDSKVSCRESALPLIFKTWKAFYLSINSLKVTFLTSYGCWFFRSWLSIK